MPLTKEQIILNRKSNQDYHKLSDAEILLHEILMKMPMLEHPESLTDYLNEKHRGDAFCGDAFACWVADWIKSSRKTVSFDDIQNPKVDKRCGTCANWSIHDLQYGCDLSSFIARYRYRESTEIKVKREMQANDGQHCSDWKKKAKEKKRVWSCLSCGYDIFFNTELKDYSHFVEVSHCGRAIPELDSGRKIKKIWTCANCGEDIIYVSSYYSYHHLKNGIINCDIEKKVATPKPDSEKWVEV